MLVSQFGEELADDLFGFGFFLHPAVSRGLPGTVSHGGVGGFQAEAFFADFQFLIASRDPFHQLLTLVVEFGSQAFEFCLGVEVFTSLFDDPFVQLAVVADKCVADLLDPLTCDFLPCSLRQFDPGFFDRQAHFERRAMSFFELGAESFEADAAAFEVFGVRGEEFLLTQQFGLLNLLLGLPGILFALKIGAIDVGTAGEGASRLFEDVAFSFE